MTFTAIILETGPDGRARFREEAIPLDDGTPRARLSALFPTCGLQLRMSPVGFSSDFHCTVAPQWLFVLAGCMEIGLRDGRSRRFLPGQHFLSADTLPVGTDFDPAVHGHCSRQVGDAPLVTAFVRCAPGMGARDAAATGERAAFSPQAPGACDTQGSERGEVHPDRDHQSHKPHG